MEWDVRQTEIGWVGIAIKDGAVVRLILGGAHPLEQVCDQLTIYGVRDPRALDLTFGAFLQYLETGKVPSRLRAGWQGETDFQKEVYDALSRVPAGRTVTYAELAQMIGRPGAARAVGRAMACNRVPVLIPCHRVVPSDGSFGAFSALGGPNLKIRLLEIEGFMGAKVA